VSFRSSKAPETPAEAGHCPHFSVNSDAVLFLSLPHGKPLTETSFPGVKVTLTTLGGRLFTYSDSSWSRNGGLDSMPCAMSVRSPRQVGMLLASKNLV
jgi:hypothetical protein